MSDAYNFGWRYEDRHCCDLDLPIARNVWRCCMLFCRSGDHRESHGRLFVEFARMLFPYTSNPSLRDKTLMSETSDDTIAASAPRYTRRLSDKILIAFHQACDEHALEVAERLLRVLEKVITAPPPVRAPRGGRRDQDMLIAAHERLWQLRHPYDEGWPPGTRRDLGRAYASSHRDSGVAGSQDNPDTPQ
jgi:hypothetical protein